MHSVSGQFERESEMVEFVYYLGWVKEKRKSCSPDEEPEFELGELKMKQYL